MATEKDFRVKSSLIAPTSLQVGSATITSDGSAVVLPANSVISDGAGGSVSLGSVDLTGYATETYVDNAVANVSVDLTGYATETYVNNTVTNYLTISSFNTQISSYALTTDVNNALALKANTSSLAAVATSGNYNDLSNTPTIPSLTGYATESWVTSQGYITSETDSQTLSFANNQITISNGNTIDVSSLYQDLTGYATETYVDNEIANLSVEDISNAQTFAVDNFSGDDSTVTFTLSIGVATSNAIIVVVDGVVQDPSTYGVNSTTLTFSEAPPTGTDNISVRFLSIPANAVDSTAYRTVTEFTATAGQLIFTVPSYQIGYINVYRNGVRLGDADFIATTGTSVTLTDAADAGDLISVESFRIGSTTTSLTNEAQWADTQSTHVIQYNAQTVTQDVTIGSNANAFSAGPIEIQAGTAVTIDDGGVWIIL